MDWLDQQLLAALSPPHFDCLPVTSCSARACLRRGLDAGFDWRALALARASCWASAWLSWSHERGRLGHLELHVGRRGPEGRGVHVVETRQRPVGPFRCTPRRSGGRSRSRAPATGWALRTTTCFVGIASGSPGSTRSGPAGGDLHDQALRRDVEGAGRLGALRAQLDHDRLGRPRARDGRQHADLVVAAVAVGGSERHLAALNAASSDGATGPEGDRGRGSGCCSRRAVAGLDRRLGVVRRRCHRGACRRRRRGAGRPRARCRGVPSRRAGAAVHADASPSPCAPP